MMSCHLNEKDVFDPNLSGAGRSRGRYGREGTRVEASDRASAPFALCDAYDPLAVGEIVLRRLPVS